MKKNVILTLLLCGLFLLIVWGKTSAFSLVVASLYFLLLYFGLFSIGEAKVARQLSVWIEKDTLRTIYFPMLLVALFCSYVLLGGGNPFKGTTLLMPFLILFPTLYFLPQYARRSSIGWYDFFGVLLYFIPLTLVELNANTNLPFEGGGFDSVSRTLAVLAVVYGIVVIRRLDVGFEVVFKFSYLCTTIVMWLLFFGIILALGYTQGFVKYVGYGPITFAGCTANVRTFLASFFHTALFEELFFRGLLQNMLEKRIRQAGNWKRFLAFGTIGLAFLSLVAGYTLKGSLQWSPLVMTTLLLAVAYYLESKQKAAVGTYASLAIISILFGLAHHHVGSSLYLALASLAGWFYGYVYLKTRNVFYAALIHALVGNSTIIFGIELVKQAMS